MNSMSFKLVNKINYFYKSNIFSYYPTIYIYVYININNMLKPTVY